MFIKKNQLIVDKSLIRTIKKDLKNTIELGNWCYHVNHIDIIS